MKEEQEPADQQFDEAFTANPTASMSSRISAVVIASMNLWPNAGKNVAL
jgi:hypothetical protein